MKCWNPAVALSPRCNGAALWLGVGGVVRQTARAEAGANHAGGDGPARQGTGLRVREGLRPARLSQTRGAARRRPSSSASASSSPTTSPSPWPWPVRGRR